MGAEQPAGRHRRQEVGDLDAVEDVGVEDDDEAGHGVLVVVEAQILGLCRHGIEGRSSAGIGLVSIGQDIGKTKSPVGPDHVMGDGTRLDLLDEMGTADVEQLAPPRRW